jgi:hypothetical protein
MKIYKRGQEMIIIFPEINDSVHIYIIKKYIEYKKRSYPLEVLRRNFEEIQYNDIPLDFQTTLNSYFENSLNNAKRKTSIFKEALLYSNKKGNL